MEEKNEEIKAIWNKRYNNFLTVLIIVCIVIFIIQKIFCISFVNGNSMFPTLKNGQIITANRSCKSLNRNDIVLFYPGNKGVFSEIFIKRIVGTPGDTIQIIDGYLYVNEEKIEDGFQLMENPGIAANPVTLCENQYFVLGDNRNYSNDSRKIGAVSKDKIIAVVNQ